MYTIYIDGGCTQYDCMYKYEIYKMYISISYVHPQMIYVRICFSKLISDHIKVFIASVYFIQIYIGLSFSIVGKYRYKCHFLTRKLPVELRKVSITEVFK